MASCIINAISSLKREHTISVSGPHLEKLEKFKSMGHHIGTDNVLCAKESDIIFLGVKPQILGSVLRDLKDKGIDFSQKLVISMAVGFSCSSIEDITKSNKTVRIMPNTPSSLGLGVTAIYFDSGVGTEQKDLTYELLAGLGLNVTVDNEEQITLLGALTGSGPAFLYRFLESLCTIATEHGLDAVQSRNLMQMLIKGTAAMIEHNAQSSLAQLREAVTSKGGTTFEGLKVMQTRNFDAMMHEVIDACIRRSHELEETLKDK